MAIVRAVIYDVPELSLTLSQIEGQIWNAKRVLAFNLKMGKEIFFRFWVNGKVITTGFIFFPISESATEQEKSLHQALQEAQMKIICLETMIDIAERELNVSIRKSLAPNSNIRKRTLLLR